MTEPSRRPIRRPSPLPVVAGALALLLVVFNLLAFQMRAKRDAVLVASRPAAAAPPRRVIERRVIVTKVIVRVRHDEGDDGSAPVTRISQTAPAPAAPAAAAPAAPAPAAPAPLTTRTS